MVLLRNTYINNLLARPYLFLDTSFQLESNPKLEDEIDNEDESRQCPAIFLTLSIFLSLFSFVFPNL